MRLIATLFILFTLACDAAPGPCFDNTDCDSPDVCTEDIGCADPRATRYDVTIVSLTTDADCLGDPDDIDCVVEPYVFAKIDGLVRHKGPVQDGTVDGYTFTADLGQTLQLEVWESDANDDYFTEDDLIVREVFLTTDDALHDAVFEAGGLLVVVTPRAN